MEIGEEMNDAESHWSDDSQNSDDLLEDIELRTGLSQRLCLFVCQPVSLSICSISVCLYSILFPYFCLILIGQCAIPCSSGVLYIGGLCKSGSSSSEILHLNLFGMYEPTDFSEKGKFSLLPLPSVHEANSTLSLKGDESYSPVTATAASCGSASLLTDAFQKWSSLSSDSLGNLTAKENSAAHENISQKKNNIKNLETISGSRSYHITEDV